MSGTLTAAELRRWASQCAAEAEYPHADGDECARLLKMRSALLQLAETQDWLDGRRLDRPSSQPNGKGADGQTDGPPPSPGS